MAKTVQKRHLKKLKNAEGNFHCARKIMHMKTLYLTICNFVCLDAHLHMQAFVCIRFRHMYDISSNIRLGFYHMRHNVSLGVKFRSDAKNGGRKYGRTKSFQISNWWLGGPRRERTRGKVCHRWFGLVDGSADQDGS